MKWKIASRIAGGLTAAALMYNAHHAGNMHSREYVKIRTGERMKHFYLPSRRMDERNLTTSKLKDKWFQMTMNWNLPDAINSAVGYVKGGFSQLANDFVPTALATGALLSKKCCKFFAIGLMCYGIKYLLCDVIGLGKINNLK